MHTSLDDLCFSRDFEGAKVAPDALRWNLERHAQLGVLVTTSPASAPDEIFEAQLVWLAYPSGLPSLKFRNLETKSTTDKTAWPVCSGFRPDSFDSCVHWTAEGHAIHPEWATSEAHRADPSGNPLFRALCFLQDTLDIGYVKRYAP